MQVAHGGLARGSDRRVCPLSGHSGQQQFPAEMWRGRARRSRLFRYERIHICDQLHLHFLLISTISGLTPGLVARRHFHFSHGIGRSGNVSEAQPKAIGSTILGSLTNELMLDVLRRIGLASCRRCLVLPLATGMTLMMCLLNLKQKTRPAGRYVLWSRIDQKSCLKCILSAGG